MLNTAANIQEMLPNPILAEILRLCDIQTQDLALCVSNHFLRAVNDARRQEVRLAALQPTRVTDELLPTRSELYLALCPQPHFKNILKIMRPLGPSREGPLYKHYQEQIELDKAITRGWLLGGKETGRCIEHRYGDTLGYFGGWINNQPEGFGKMLDSDNPSRARSYFGLNYEGTYASGKRHGYGFMLSQNNFWFEGFFKNDHAHGRGVFFKVGPGRPHQYDVKKRDQFKINKTEGFFVNGAWESKTDFSRRLTDIMDIESLIQNQKIFKKVTLNREFGFIHHESRAIATSVVHLR